MVPLGPSAETEGHNIPGLVHCLQDPPDGLQGFSHWQRKLLRATLLLRHPHFFLLGGKGREGLESKQEE